MKRFIFISALAAITILSIFVIELFSQKEDDKVKAFNESITLATEGNYDKAISALTKIYESNKEDFLINMRLGYLNYYKGSYSESKQYYQKAVSLKKNSIDAMLGLTLPLAALKEWEEVNKLYLSILKLDENNYTANLRLGQNYLITGNYTQAKKHLEKVYGLYPSEYEANLSLGWTYYYLGNTTKAKELFVNTLMLSPNDSLAIQGLQLIR